MAIETRHLRCFLAVAETLHFGQAAERLHLAQPAVSRTVGQLERELGTLLLERTTRSVSLTPAGEEYAERARSLLAQLDLAGEAARDVAAGRSGVLRVGVTGSATYGYLPALARVAAEAMPDVHLHVETELLTPQQEQALLDDRLDLGVLRSPIGSPDLQHVLVRPERLVVALPEDHPLAAGAPDAVVDVADLADEDFVTYADRSGSVVLRTVLAACEDAGFVPRRPHQVTATSTAVALVAAGRGVALLPESASALTLTGVTFRPTSTRQRLDLTLAWPAARRRPVVTRLLRALHEAGLAPAVPAAPGGAPHTPAPAAPHTPAPAAPLSAAPATTPRKATA